MRVLEDSVFSPLFGSLAELRSFARVIEFVLWPTQNTNLRREIDYWCLSRSIRPWVVAEFEDSALMKAFGHAAAGLFPAPLIKANEVKQLYGAELVGGLAVRGRSPVGRAAGSCGRSARNEEDDDPG